MPTGKNICHVLNKLRICFALQICINEAVMVSECYVGTPEIWLINQISTCTRASVYDNMILKLCAGLYKMDRNSSDLHTAELLLVDGQPLSL